jgi:hypothetical protein
MGFTLKSGNNPTMKGGVLSGRSSSPLTKVGAAAGAAAQGGGVGAGGQKAANEQRWSEGSGAAEKRTSKSLNELVAMRKKLEKGSPEYNAIQNEINIALGDSTRHEQEKKTVIKDEETGEKMKIKKTGEGDDTKITVKGDEGKTKIKTEGDESDTKKRGTVKSTIKKVGSKIKGGVQKLKDKRAAKKASKQPGYAPSNPEDLSEAQIKGRNAEAEYDKQQEKQNKKKSPMTKRKKGPKKVMAMGQTGENTARAQFVKGARGEGGVRTERGKKTEYDITKGEDKVIKTVSRAKKGSKRGSWEPKRTKEISAKRALRQIRRKSKRHQAHVPDVPTSKKEKKNKLK